MLKLILHHTYKAAGEAVDVSYNENHGFRTSVTYLPDGTQPGSGVLEFAGGPSRVRVTNKPIWQSLLAVKIETWIRLTALGQRRNLVEGDSSFAFFIEHDGVLWGTFLGAETPGASPTWHGATTDVTYAPDGVRRTVPLNTWIKATYVHDGISSLRLYINDQLVGANYKLISAVPPLGPNGVHIGHWPGDDRYTFSGDIDDVQIWKYDPDVPTKQFFCRPLEAKQLECWRQYFDSMADVLKKPDQSKLFIGLMHCLSGAEEDLIRAIRSKGEAAMQRSDEFSARYRDLWCSGKIDDAAMKQFYSDWLAWVQQVDAPAYQAYRQRIQSCTSEFHSLGLDQLAKGIAACDPSFAKYLDVVRSAVEPPPPPPPPPSGLIQQLLQWLMSLFGQRSP